MPQLRLRLPGRPALVQAGVRAQTCRSRAQWPDSAATRQPEVGPSPDNKPFYLESEDPYKRGIPGANLKFSYSYGDPQPVAVIAKRSLGAVTAKWKVNGGAERSSPTRWTGDSYTPPALTTTRFAASSPARIQVTPSRSGSRVVASAASRSPTRRSPRPATRSSSWPPRTTPAPHRCRRPVQAEVRDYTDALKANRINADVYDVDARNRTALPARRAQPLRRGRVVSRATTSSREGRMGPGNADRLALDEMLEFRAYLNEGGRVLYTGDQAGRQYAGSGGVGTSSTTKGRSPATRSRRGRPAAVSGAARLR